MAESTEDTKRKVIDGADAKAIALVKVWHAAELLGAFDESKRHNHDTMLQYWRRELKEGKEECQSSWRVHPSLRGSGRSTGIGNPSG